MTQREWRNGKVVRVPVVLFDSLSHLSEDHGLSKGEVVAMLFAVWEACPDFVRDAALRKYGALRPIGFAHEKTPPPTGADDGADDVDDDSGDQAS